MHPLVFRLVSSMKYPQYISLDPKPPPPPVYVSASLELLEVTHYLARSREPDCEDDETQANVRRIRAQSVAVGFESLVKAAMLTGQFNPKVVLNGIVVVLYSNLRSLSPLKPRYRSPKRLFLYLCFSSLKRFAQQSEARLDIRRPRGHHTSPGCLALSCL